jgi:hypothetical protein
MHSEVAIDSQAKLKHEAFIINRGGAENAVFTQSYEDNTRWRLVITIAANSPVSAVQVFKTRAALRNLKPSLRII